MFPLSNLLDLPDSIHLLQNDLFSFDFIVFENGNIHGLHSFFFIFLLHVLSFLFV